MNKQNVEYKQRVCCIICENENLEERMKIKDFDTNSGIFDLLFCPKCGMYYTSPYPTEETISFLYNSRETKNFDQNNSFLFDYLKDFLLKRQIKNIKANSFVDFGTGNARLACMLKELNPEAIITAVDFCKEIPSRLKDDKYNSIKYVHTGDFFIDEVRYDVIFLKHVLEHVHNPIEFLKTMDKKLNSDGVLIVEVPNIHSGISKAFKKYSSLYYPPFHIVHFTPENLKFILEKLNYEFIISNIETPIISNIIANLFKKPLNNWFRLLGVVFYPLQILLNTFNNSSTTLLAIIKKTH